MKVRLGCFGLLFVCLTLSLTAQTAVSNSSIATVQVPRLVKLTGTLTGAAADNSATGMILAPGAAPTNVVAVTFSLYAEPSGGVPLWSEVQNVRVDAAGHYTVQLGSTKADGLPVELFSSVEAQWLGVQQQGQAEQPRVMLLSVPYALKAADAETFGGKPPSAYLQAGTSAANGVNGVTPLGKVQNDHPLSLSGSGTTNYIALWTNANTLASSVIYQASNHDLGIGTTIPSYPLDVVASTTAISGNSTATSGEEYGVYGTSQSTAGVGIYGGAGANTGEAYGVYGTSDSATGVGVYGSATSTSGASFGIYGTADSPEGVGVSGAANATSGTSFGVSGTSESPTGVGVAGTVTTTTGANIGVFGATSSTSGTGVSGAALATTGFAVGVAGNSDSSAGAGVVGSATAETGAAFGVKGVTSSSAGVGVYGVALATSGANYAVEGSNASSSGVGVLGETTSSTGPTTGVQGVTASPAEGIGALGVGVDTSDESASVAERPVGVWGDTNQDGAGVVGSADNGIGVAGYNNARSISTADFQNDESTGVDAPVLVTRGTHYDGFCIIDVSGNVSCTGSISGGARLNNGERTVATYAVQAAENWLEDAGSARLSNGSATVAMDATFAQTINGAADYHVFLTPKGDCKGLYVTNETPEGFEVRELGGGTANIAFDYRILAHRRGYESLRLVDETQRFRELAKQARTVHAPRVRTITPANASTPQRMAKLTPPVFRHPKTQPLVRRQNSSTQHK